MAPIAIDQNRFHLLNDIKKIFDANKPEFKIIIGPNRKNIYLNPQDRTSLKLIFDEKRIYDYSYSHIEDLAVDTLLYDKTHYRLIYAKYLMMLTYQLQDSVQAQ